MKQDKKQVSVSHYKFRHYDNLERFASYWHQLDLILAEEPASVLEIGVGTKVMSNYLKSNTGILNTSLDIASDLSPDYLGDVKALPFADNSYDLVCAFEVLEHLPFDQFENCLKELKRVSKKVVVLSLPHFGPIIKFDFKFPFVKEKKIMMKIPISKVHKFNGQHYWEIGKKEFSLKKILNILRQYFIVSKQFVAFDSPYHHFFVLIKK